MKRLPFNNKGMTVIEVIASLLIAGALIWGLTIAYVHGLRRFDAVASEFQMISEGQLVLSKLEQLIRLADKVEVRESDEPLRSKLDLTYFDHRRDGRSGGIVNLYSNINDESLRMNYRKDDINDFNIRLLPRTTLQLNRRDRFGTYPYRVKLMSFRYGEEELDIDFDLDPMQAKYIVLIDMILEARDSTQVYLTAAQSKFN